MAKGIAERVISSQDWLDGVADKIQPAWKGIFEAGGDVGRVAKDFLHGVWLGHPLHPVITDVPVGSWTMAQVLDIVSVASGEDKHMDQAADIALFTGILGAGAAAVTGMADWSETEGSRRRVGMAHALLNVAGLSMNIASLVLRMGSAGGKPGRGTARTLSALGYVTSAAAAYVAGELVYNLGQGVSRNSFVEGPGEFRDAGDAAELLKEGEMTHAQVEGYDVVFVKHDDGIHAFGGTCSHYGCGLWEGKLEEHTVTCQCHGSQFDIRDGSVKHGPAVDPVPCYEVKTQIGRVLVKIED
jgi:nitrite reductase/ring-hydroxylating ferredoxin subunit/uncharacterized membrane protein